MVVFRSRFKRNLIFNYTGSIFTSIVPIVAIPFYVNMLGVRGYGLVGFVILIQSILGVLESGLAQTLVKEFIFCRVNNDNATASKILSSFELFYGLVSLFFACAIYLSSDFLAGSWLNVSGEYLPDAVSAIQVTAFLVMGALLGSLYRSALLSLDSHFSVNIINSFAIILKHLIGILVVFQFKSTISLLVWFASFSVMETVVRRFWVFKKFKEAHLSIRSIGLTVIPILRSSASLVFATLIGALAVQSDKVISSSLLTIEQFGYFSIASTLSLGFLQLVYPIQTSSLPFIISSIGKPKELSQCNMRSARVLSILFILAWFFLILLGKHVMLFWISDLDVTNTVYPLLLLLFVGTTLNAFCGIGLNNLLAFGRSGCIMLSNCAGFASAIVLLPFFISNFGLLGAASGWIAYNAVTLVVMIVYFSRFVAKDHQAK